MTEEELNKYFARAGEELAGLVMAGFVSKVKDELYGAVSTAQRAQGAATAEAERQKAEAGRFERDAIKFAHEGEQLKRENAKLKPENETLRKENAELKEINARAKEERLRAAGKALNILHGENGG